MQSSADAITLAAVIIRGVVLVVAALGGVLSIYLGWRLYREGMASQVSAELSKGQEWRVKMRAAGPGIFFTLFGMILLVYLVRQQMVVEDVTAVPTEETVSNGPVETVSGGQSLAQARFWLAQANSTRQPAVQRPRRVCLVRGIRISLSDGNALSVSAIRRAIENVASIVPRLDRSRLSIRERAALDGSLDILRDLADASRYGEER